MATTSRVGGAVVENRRAMLRDPLPTETLMPKLDESALPELWGSPSIDRANFGENSLFGRRFSRVVVAILTANYSCSPVPLERGDHQLYWERMGEARRVGVVGGVVVASWWRRGGSSTSTEVSR